MRTKPTVSVHCTHTNSFVCLLFSFIRLFIHSFIQCDTIRCDTHTPNSIENGSEPEQIFLSSTDGAMPRKSKGLLSFLCSLLLLLLFLFIFCRSLVVVKSIQPRIVCALLSSFPSPLLLIFCLGAIASIVSIALAKMKLRMFRWNEWDWIWLCLWNRGHGGHLVHNKSAFAKQKRTSF